MEGLSRARSRGRSLGGFCATTGDVDTRPLKGYGELNFVVSGCYTAIAALSALRHARETAEGVEAVGFSELVLATRFIAQERGEFGAALVQPCCTTTCCASWGWRHRP